MHKIFDDTIRHYKINASELARRCEISTASISRFRSGHVNLTTEKLENLLAAMEEIQPGSRRHFCMLLAGENPQDMLDQIEFLGTKELSILLIKIADRFAETQSAELVGTLT